MSEKERAVYELIRAHYLAQFLPHHEFDRTVARLTCAGHSLQAVGKQVVEPGWHLALPGKDQDAANDEADQRSQTLPVLVSSTQCAVGQVELKALRTQPPKPFTQGELVKAMRGVAKLVADPRLKAKLRDTTGIGTEATRAGIINTLLSRGYLAKKGRAIRATDAAFTLIDAVPSAITDPGTTAIWEQALDMIEAGQMTLDTFIDRQSAWVAQLVQHYRGAVLSIKLPQGPACPACGAATRQRSGKNGAFWSCGRFPDCKGSVPIESPGHRRRATSRKPRRSSPAAS
jgi:DNA topoisomerase-3